MAQSINIAELNLPQLEMLKNQLDQEVEFLSTSIAQLKVVETKYVGAKDCLNVLNKSNEGKELLVPLTTRCGGCTVLDTECKDLQLHYLVELPESPVRQELIIPTLEIGDTEFK
uniref:Prefoldin subunit 5 n=1 Tax=Cebus imitator TaxID=2715852 RepID=A0A2K5PDY7_CEBIM